MDLVDPEQILYEEVSAIIERGRHEILLQASRSMVMIFWQVGIRINSEVLDNKRADYGKQIVSRPATQLNWAHFVEILPLKTQDAKLFYLDEAARGHIGRDELRELINRKAYERKEIANAQITDAQKIPLNTFKDPYLFDVLGLKDDYMEADLEAAILRELEKFILEFGKGFAFVERQKRMIMDGADFHLDLLFYNRYLKRLVAVELK